jgi:hypothetical protein
MALDQELNLTEEAANWLGDALAELKTLRGWAWDGEDFENFREVITELGENPDNY